MATNSNRNVEKGERKKGSSIEKQGQEPRPRHNKVRSASTSTSTSILGLAVIVVVSIVALVWQTTRVGGYLYNERTTTTGNNNNTVDTPISNSHSNSNSTPVTVTVTVTQIEIPNNQIQIQTTAASHCVHQRITTAQNLQQLHSNTNHTTRSTSQHPTGIRKQQRRPILYLHPGPAKTATSTIQQLLTNYQENLAADNIFLLASSSASARVPDSCHFPHPSICNPHKCCCHSVMQAQLDEYYRHGVDLVLTSEVLGMKFAQLPQGPPKLEAWFREVVQRNNNEWDIRVLIGYRPYFDFAVSGFNQQFKNRNRPKLQRWPSKGGVRIPSVTTGVLDKYMQDKEGKKTKLLVEFPFTDVLVELFRPYANRVEVYDITATAAPHHSHSHNNNSKDFTEYVFCELLEGADGACRAQQAVLASSEALLNKNRAESLDYDRLATAAVDRGLINVRKASPHVTRGWVGQQIRAYLEDNNTHTNKQLLPTNVTVTGNGTMMMMTRTRTNITEQWPPLVCPDTAKEANRKALAQLYTVALAHEQHLFPARDPHWQVPAQFDQMIHDQKLCDLDLDRVLDLDDDDWQTFLRALQQ